MPDLKRLFADDTTTEQEMSFTSTSSSNHILDACSANAYVYEDFTQSGWVRVTFVVLYVVIVVLSVVGNSMVIWTIARNRHMRTVTNYYILNLAIADFLVALVVMPLKLVEYTAPCQWHVFSRHSVLCPLLYYILPVFVFTSVLTLAAISVERSVTNFRVPFRLLPSGRLAVLIRRCTDTSDLRHFGPKTFRHQCRNVLDISAPLINRLMTHISVHVIYYITNFFV